MFIPFVSFAFLSFCYGLKYSTVHPCYGSRQRWVSTTTLSSSLVKIFYFKDFMKGHCYFNSILINLTEAKQNKNDYHQQRENSGMCCETTSMNCVHSGVWTNKPNIAPSWKLQQTRGARGEIDDQQDEGNRRRKRLILIARHSRVDAFPAN